MIQFFGWQDKEKIASLYKNVDIFIGPGRSVIESMLFENLVIAIGSKGYVGIIDEENYLDGIYTNFGGDRNKTDIELLYKDFIKVLDFNKSLIKEYQQLSKIIVDNFFDLEILNQKLFSIYKMVERTFSIKIKKENEKMEKINILLKKIKAYQNNSNQVVLETNDYFQAGLKKVNKFNILNINKMIKNNQVNSLEDIQNIIDKVNESLNYLVITIDTEAHYKRQSNDFVNKLIYGKMNGKQLGINEMMNIADEVGINLTFYLDILEEFRYPGEIVEVAKNIVDRGFDLQLHAHPEIIPDKSWEYIMPKNWKQNDWNEQEALIMFETMLDIFIKNNLPIPTSFRGGAYRYNENTIKILKKFGFKTSSNYNAFISKPDNQPKGWGYNGPFWWSNGILELPISYVPKNCDTDITHKDRLDNFMYEKEGNKIWDRMRAVKKCLKYPPIHIMIMHSWSFLYEEAILEYPKYPKYYIYKDDKKFEAYKNFLKNIPDDFKVVSITELYQLIQDGVIKIDNVELLDRIEKKQEVLELNNQKSINKNKNKLQWFSKNKKKCAITQIENSINMKLYNYDKNDIIYIESEAIDIENIQSIKIDFEVDKKYKTNLSFYIIFLDEKLQKKSYISYKINTNNRIEYIFNDNNTKIKFAIRISSINDKLINIKNFTYKVIYNENKNFLNEEYIKNLPVIPKTSYLLSPLSFSDSYNFKPRKDVNNFEIKLPLNWDINPFDDNNWKFQLHSLRMIDTELNEYMKTKNSKLLDRILEVILDWKKDIIDTKKNFDFNREENKDSFAWHDMATGLRVMKLAYIIEELIKLNEDTFINDYLKDFKELIRLHIEALSNQKLGAGNHAIFQIHGLMLLLRLLPDTEYIELRKKTLQNIKDKFFQQFHSDGIHSENSAGYHYLGVNTFEKILIPEIYQGLEKEIFDILNQAKKNCAYMHFPNNEILTTGDTDFKLVDLRKEEEKKDGITYFDKSGYIYICEKDSMFYMKTAFLNRGHAQADFFNILLYEYGKNILVDAGKYNYMKDNPFRKYCMSTRAHNTVLIDNEDYKLDTKYFFESKVVLAEEKDGLYIVKTKHNYPYFANTEHKRIIVYKPKEFLVVLDKLKADEVKNFKQIFHLHQDLEVERVDNYLISSINEEVNLYINNQIISSEGKRLNTLMNFSKGADGEIEGYRALGHNEITENYVLYSEVDEKEVCMMTTFSFNRKMDIIFKDNMLIIESLKINI